MTTLRFLHFPSMNTNFRKSSQFTMSSVSVSTANYERSLRDFISSMCICFLSPVEKNINQISGNKSEIKHCLIETNSLLIGEFIFILNIDWMVRNNYMSPKLTSSL